jgi:hypothetical protein
MGTLFTLPSTTPAGCDDIHDKDRAKSETDCSGTCFNRGGTAVVSLQRGCSWIILVSDVS